MIRFLGSLKIAMLLFVVLIVASAIGTLLESRFDARVARYYLYDAPWFTLWLGVLCLNLTAAAFSRWPWQKRHTGFIVVHSGIIILIAGAWVGHRYGIEGSMTLRVGEAPRNWMLVQDMALSFTDPGDGQTLRTPFPVDLRPPRSDRLETREAPSGRVRFVFDRFSESLLEETYAVPFEGGGPAVNLRLTSGLMRQTVSPALFSAPGDASTYILMRLAQLRLVEEIVRPVPDAAGRLRPEMQLRVAGGGRVAYLIVNSRGQMLEGTLGPGESTATGWADWVLTLETAFAAAAPSRRIVEKDATLLATGAKLHPGVRGWMEARDGQRSEPQWFLAGENYTLHAGAESATMAFGYRTERLPFQVALEKFEVPRDEGTQTPANFKSTLVFNDPVAGVTHRDWCGMNTPAVFPAGLVGQFTGLSWKFSQASWNPEDLNESTVQVLRDPGWLGKWIGSLVVTVGLLIIFYMKPYRFNRPEDAVDRELAAARAAGRS